MMIYKMRLITLKAHKVIKTLSILLKNVILLFKVEKGNRKWKSKVCQDENFLIVVVKNWFYQRARR